MEWDQHKANQALERFQLVFWSSPELLSVCGAVVMCNTCYIQDMPVLTASSCGTGLTVLQPIFREIRPLFREITSIDICPKKC